jgi:hypothetical protein
VGEAKQGDVRTSASVSPRAISGSQALTHGGSFDELLTELMAIRDISVGQLARRVPCTAGHISNLSQATEEPTRHIASKLDEVLKADGRLLELAESNRMGWKQPPVDSQDDTTAYAEGLSLYLPYVPGRLVIEISSPARSQDLGDDHMAVERGGSHELQ